jgi:DNA-binding protein H-NS
MAIPEAQLETWTGLGSVQQSKTTYQSIKNVLEHKDAPYAATGWISKKAAAARQEIEAKLAALGGSDVGATGGKTGRTAARGSKLKGRKVPPKYRNPKNRSETWAGRGAMPRWLRAEVRAGKKLEQFAIKRGRAKKAA